MRNFQVIDKETGKEYWISRAIAVCGIVVVNMDDNKNYLFVNKRGKGTPNFQGCWNLPCGYLDWDETTKQAVSREVEEECHISIPPTFWELFGINDNPSEGNQNVTLRYFTFLTEDEYRNFSKEYYEKRENNLISKGEIDEVDVIELMPLNLEEINKKNWAFNHKELITNKIYKHYGNK